MEHEFIYFSHTNISSKLFSSSKNPILSIICSTLVEEIESFTISLNLFSTSAKLIGFAGSPLGASAVFLYTVPSFIFTATRAPRPSSRTRVAFTFFINRFKRGSLTFSSVNLSNVTFPSARDNAARNHRLNLPSTPILGSVMPAEVKATGPVSMFISSTSSILGWYVFLISSRRSIVECVQAQLGYGLKLRSEI